LHVISSIEDAKALEGVEVGLSDWVIIDQNRIDQFAEATGDYQWIHVDTERAAAEMPSGKTIAHGYLTLALIPALTGNFVEIENLARAINFGVLLLTSETRIEVENERKPACVAETLGMYFFGE
jgi:acyl dehydratase